MNPTFEICEVDLVGGPRLEVARQGPRGGLPVLMLHGITDSWRSFEPVLPWLPADWQVIVPSQRGHGGSAAGASYRTRDFAEDAAALLLRLGIREPALVVGHSMGSSNAFRMAIDHPQAVRAVVGAGAFAGYADKPDLVAFRQAAIDPLTDPVPCELARDFQAGTIAAPVAPGLLEAMTQESLKVPAAVWRAAFAGLFEDDFKADLGRVRCPALLLWGEADAFVPRSDQHHLAQALPAARIAAWAGAGHALHWEQPQRFALELARFVEDLDALRSPALQFF